VCNANYATQPVGQISKGQSNSGRSNLRKHHPLSGQESLEPIRVSSIDPSSDMILSMGLECETSEIISLFAAKFW